MQAVFDRIQQRGAFTDFGNLGNVLGSVTDTVRVDETLADEDLVATAWVFRGVGEPEFVSAPVGAAGTEAGRPVVYLDNGRASRLWGHLRQDDLVHRRGTP